MAMGSFDQKKASIATQSFLQPCQTVGKDVCFHKTLFDGEAYSNVFRR